MPHRTVTNVKSIIELHRNKRGASTKDLRHAAALLIAAAGVKLPPSLNVTAEATTNISTDAANSQYFSGLQFVGQTNVPALKELARVYEAGMPIQLSAVHAKHIAGWKCRHFHASATTHMYSLVMQKTCMYEKNNRVSACAKPCVATA